MNDAAKWTHCCPSPFSTKDSVIYPIRLPDRKAFVKIPARFGHVPVAEEPLGYDRGRRFEHHYPRIELPSQLVDTVETGIKKRYERDKLFHIDLNRLFFGDCLPGAGRPLRRSHKNY